MWYSPASEIWKGGRREPHRERHRRTSGQVPLPGVPAVLWFPQLRRQHHQRELGAHRSSLRRRVSKNFGFFFFETSALNKIFYQWLSWKLASLCWRCWSGRQWWVARCRWISRPRGLRSIQPVHQRHCSHQGSFSLFYFFTTMFEWPISIIQINLAEVCAHFLKVFLKN